MRKTMIKCWSISMIHLRNINFYWSLTNGSESPPQRKCCHLYQSLHHTLHEIFHHLPFFNMPIQPTLFLNNNFVKVDHISPSEFYHHHPTKQNAMHCSPLSQAPHERITKIQPWYNLQFKHWCSFSILMKLSPQQLLPRVVLSNSSVERW